MLSHEPEMEDLSTPVRTWLDSRGCSLGEDTKSPFISHYATGYSCSPRTSRYFPPTGPLQVSLATRVAFPHGYLQPAPTHRDSHTESIMFLPQRQIFRSSPDTLHIHLHTRRVLRLLVAQHPSQRNIAVSRVPGGTAVPPIVCLGRSLNRVHAIIDTKLDVHAVLAIEVDFQSRSPGLKQQQSDVGGPPDLHIHWLRDVEVAAAELVGDEARWTVAFHGGEVALGCVEVESRGIDFAGLGGGGDAGETEAFDSSARVAGCEVLAVDGLVL